MKVRVRENNGKREIFCIIRKCWLVYGDEEMVRQQFILHLINSHYPQGSIGVEIGFTLSDVKPLRADIVVFDPKGAPFLVVECKAQEVKIDQEVFRQVSKYNSHFKAPYVALTNLKNNYIFQSEDHISYKAVNTIPEYPTTRK